MTMTQTKSRKLYTGIALPALLLQAALNSSTASAATPNLCYAIADQPGDDDMVTILRDGTANGVNVSGNDTNTTRIEAITLSLDSTIVYAANANVFGTVSTTTETFTQIGSGFGTGSGAAGSISFSDVDGLAIDARSGIIYGASRRVGATDVLFQINPSTGAYVPDAFGTGIDYVVFDTENLGGVILDVDDIAVDPTDGQMYGVANASGGSDRLIKIDKEIGTVTDIGRLRDSAGNGIDDVEGYSFFNAGEFYATTGQNGAAATNNTLYQIDKSTGVMTTLNTFGIHSDYEAVACLTAGSNIISGQVFQDFNENGINDGSDTGTPNITARLYIDENNNGVVDIGDTLIQSQPTDPSGNYQFEVAITGNFVLDIRQTDLDTGAFMTSDNIEVANFIDYDNTDTGNDFSWHIPDYAVCSNATFDWSPSIGSGNEWLTANASTGDNNTYTVNYLDSGGDPATVDVTVTLTDAAAMNFDDNFACPSFSPDGSGGCVRKDTETNGVYGSDYLTVGMASTTAGTQRVIFDFSFSKPIYMTSHLIDDIDDIGTPAGATHADTYQDVVEISASLAGNNVPLEISGGININLTGQVAEAIYTPDLDTDYPLGNPDGSIEVASATPFDAYRIQYYNGPDDAAAEPNNNGISNGDAIRFSGFSFCVAEPADLSLEKTASLDPVLSGEPLVYTLTVTNNGPATALANTVVTDSLPSELTYGSATVTTGSGTCSFSDPVITCTITSNIDVGSTAAVTINTTVN